MHIKSILDLPLEQGPWPDTMNENYFWFFIYIGILICILIIAIIMVNRQASYSRSRTIYLAIIMGTSACAFTLSLLTGIIYYNEQFNKTSPNKYITELTLENKEYSNSNYKAVFKNKDILYESNISKDERELLKSCDKIYAIKKDNSRNLNVKLGNFAVEKIKKADSCILRSIDN